MDTEEIAQEVAEKVEEIGRDPHLKRIANSPYFLPAAIGVAALIGGGVVGYFLGRRRSVTIVEAEDEPLPQPDLNVGAAIRDARPTRTVVEETTTDTSVTLTAEEVQERYDISEFLLRQLGPAQSQTARQGAHPAATPDPTPPPAVEVEVVTQSVFAQNDDTWNYEEEVKSRSTTAPYILHKDEFFADEQGYTQTTFTWYASDEIMVDEEDTPVYNHAQILGELKFGHGSGDPRTCYIRNDRRKSEYEVLLHDGSYAEEVLGLSEEDEPTARDLKHSNEIPRFRLE